jgi:rhodanese-related sulfurtransferase
MEMPEPRTAMSRRRLLCAGGVIGVATAAGWWRLARYRPSHEGGMLGVQAAHAQARAGEILLVDIRTPGEWRRTGVPEGAVPLDMRRDDFINRLDAFVAQDPTRPVALICAGGVRSARLSRQLLAAGYQQVIDVPEGLHGSSAGPGWLASDLPVRPWNG